MNQAPLVLVDGSSYLYRAYHALPPLTTANGQPTGAIKGVLNMLQALRKQYPQSPFAVVFDAKGPTFRNTLFEHYKSNRPPMPDELRSQIAPLHACIQALGLPLLCVEGVEADDVIGTLAHRWATQQQEVVISTGDKDMAQLVSPQITLVDTMSGKTLDCAGVRNKFGVDPALIIDYLALMGDASDNIPGVPKVGKKTALGLLQGLKGGLDVIYEHLEQVPSLPIRGAKSLPKKLTEHRAIAYLSRQLATIKTDVPLETEPSQLQPRDPDIQTLRTLYQTLEFRNELEALADNPCALPPNPAVDTHYTLILTPTDFATWLQQLQQAEVFALDTETTGLDVHQAELVGLSFATQPGQAAYIPLHHSYVGVPEQLSAAEVLEALRPLLEDSNHTKICQNAKFDLNVLLRQGIHLRGLIQDTMLESYVLNATASRHDMDTLAQRHLGLTPTSFESIAGKGSKQLTFDQIPLEQAGPYAAEDADITLRLHQHLWSALQAEPQLLQVFTTIEMPLVPILARIERQGALVDTQLLQQQSLELGEQLQQLEKQAHELAGEPFNLNSPGQLCHILYEKLGCPIRAKTPKGQPSTAESVLLELAAEGQDLPRLLLEHRSLSKLKNTYTDRLPQQVNPQTGRIHTSYHQAVTATGRLSSANPNLQNIPVRSPQGRRIRQAFIAAPGHQLLAADYSQIELRIMAHLAQDTGLQQAFQEGLDVHKATAAEIFGVPLTEVSSEQRYRAKAINFGLIYGMSAFGLAKQISVERHEAQMYIDRYFERYPGILAYMAHTREQAAEQGYVETLFGRRLYLPEIKSRNAMRRRAAERTAINAPMQGTAADIIKKAMVAVDTWLQTHAPAARVILQVHDELVLEVPDSQREAVQKGVSQCMAAAAELSVPLVVDTGYGNNWDEAH